jgi:periplasmic copper chaperone A
MKKVLMAIIFMTSLQAQEFTKSRVRLMPPNASATGAFVNIQNPYDYDLTLLKASSSKAKTVELHTHMKEDGMMKMREVPKIVIPSKGKVQLKPGSYHIMLIGLTSPLKLNEEIAIKLKFKELNKEITIRPKVKKVGSMH